MCMSSTSRSFLSTASPTLRLVGAPRRWQVGLMLGSHRRFCGTIRVRGRWLSQRFWSFSSSCSGVGATWHDGGIAGNSNPIALYKASAARAVRRTAMHVALPGADEAAPVSTNAVPPVGSKSSKGPSCEQAGTAADLLMPARSQSLPARLLRVAPDWSDC